MQKTGFWYDDAVFYSIYPLGAVTFKHENDYVPSTEGLERLSGWANHIAGLGCNAVYFAPLFESKTHGYDTTDYRKIDSRLGTNGQFADLVKQYHEAGLRVVVDGVFNHTGRDFFAFQDIRSNRESSPYKDWYRGVHFGADNPLGDGFSYEAWRGHFELPRLNPHTSAVREYLFDTVRRWVREFDIDGIRLDCADCLEPDFMKELRKLCTGMKRDFWLMGEIIHGDYNRWANPETLHSVTNYECHKGLYSSHNDGNLHEIAYSVNRQFGSGGIYKNLRLYNFADNHDVNRLADTVKNPGFLPTIYTLLYTIPGIPSLYYGSEWGIRGTTDRVTDWNLRPYIDMGAVSFDNPALMEHIRLLAKVRAENKALRGGDYTQLTVSSHQYAFRRSLDGEEATVIINISDRPETVAVTAKAGSLTDLLSGESIPVTGGQAAVPVPAHGSRILTAAAVAVKAPAPGQTSQPAPAVSPEPAPRAPEPPVPQPEQPPVTQTPSPPPPPVQPAPPPPASGSAGYGGDPVLVVRRRDIPPVWIQGHPVFEHEKRPVVDTGQTKACFFELAPGKSADPYHYHTAQEEIYFIIEGSGLLRTPAGERRVSSGDLIFFPACAEGAHRLINNHHEPLRFLAFAAAFPGDVTVYPDSRKVRLNNDIIRLAGQADLYDGE